MDDCVVALVEDIADGYVLPNQDSIESGCIRYNVSELFHEGGGTYTKIVLKVLDRVNNADEVVRNKEGSGWQDWVNANCRLLVFLPSAVDENHKGSLQTM